MTSVDQPQYEPADVADAIHSGKMPEGASLALAAGQSSDGMGRIVGSGMAWMLMGTVGNKLLTSIAQWVMGRQLDAGDFAAFAFATSIAGFTMVCREAGMRELLVQRGPEKYESLAGPAFWLAFWYNVLVSAIMAIIALPVAHALKMESVAPVLWVFAVALPIGTVGGILQNRLRLELRFRDLAANATLGNVVRQGSSILFALSGFGVMSLAWPALVSTIAEALGAVVRTKDKIWLRKGEARTWPTLLRQSKWLMYASLANFAVDWGPFLALSLFAMMGNARSEVLRMLGGVASVPEIEAGFFYFAFSITAQVGVLLSFNLMVVLTPALTRLNAQPERQADASLRALRSLMMAGSIISLGLASVIAPLETLLWHGKWERTVFCVIVLGVFFPWRVTFGVSSALLQAQGRFKRYAYLTLIEGAGFTLFALLGAAISPTADAMAWSSGLWLLVSRLALTTWIFRRLNTPWLRILGSMLAPWTVALIAAGAAIGVGWLTQDALGDFVRRVLPSLSAKGAIKAVAVAEVFLCGCTCTIIFLVLCRVFLRTQLAELIAVTPARFRPLLARVLLLPVPPA